MPARHHGLQAHQRAHFPGIVGQQADADGGADHQFLAADALAQGADTLITCGAPQSNHCRITLAAAVTDDFGNWTRDFTAGEALWGGTTDATSLPNAGISSFYRSIRRFKTRFGYPTISIKRADTVKFRSNAITLGGRNTHIRADICRIERSQQRAALYNVAFFKTYQRDLACKTGLHFSTLEALSDHLRSEVAS